MKKLARRFVRIKQAAEAAAAEALRRSEEESQVEDLPLPAARPESSNSE